MDKNAFLIQLSESDRTQLGRVEFGDQSDEQRVFSAIWELESQVNNGGFAQYFSGAEGHTADFAPAALRQIGAANCADIVARALRIVSPRALPEDQGSRQQLVEALDNGARVSLESLDEEFLAYPDNLTNLLFDYVRSNPEVFGSIAKE
jgi:hypothetical protein